MSLYRKEINVNLLLISVIKKTATARINSFSTSHHIEQKIYLAIEDFTQRLH